MLNRINVFGRLNNLLNKTYATEAGYPVEGLHLWQASAAVSKFILRGGSAESVRRRHGKRNGFLVRAEGGEQGYRRARSRGHVL